MPKVDVDRYLERLGVAAPETPSMAGLRALHAAHVARVPYETLEIHLGRATTVDPEESVARILRGRGGYCFHLNGAFATLLDALGYAVTWHRGGVQGSQTAQPPGANANHLALTVVCEGETWLVDVGLGDALYEPLPLRAGEYRQGPFAYRLSRSAVEPDGWRFDHDPHGSFAGMDFTMAPARPEDFAAQHRELSTSPSSGFVRVASAIRRDAVGTDELRGCLLVRTRGDGRSERELTTEAAWFGALAEVFGLTLTDVGEEERSALWKRVRSAHREWLAARSG
ncbi:arylamine N-acetyltransferase family protein [Streptomyces sp. NPDC001312]|uniref:arylamine N-acetyltransferase family protein n=1 Tax=Streptomyces sp. NPDC001312 TaxID=3364561 RepID=UPI0036A0ED68